MCTNYFNLWEVVHERPFALGTCRFLMWFPGLAVQLQKRTFKSERNDVSFLRKNLLKERIELTEKSFKKMNQILPKVLQESVELPPPAPQSDKCTGPKEDASPTSVAGLAETTELAIVRGDANELFLPRFNKPVSSATKFRETHRIRSKSPTDFTNKSPNFILRKKFMTNYVSENAASVVLPGTI